MVLRPLKPKAKVAAGYGTENRQQTLADVSADVSDVSPVEGDAKAQQARRSNDDRFLGLLLRLISFGPLLILIAVWIGFSIASPAFLTSINVKNLLAQSSADAILAFAALLVIIVGQLDLSIGSSMGLATVVGAWMYRQYPGFGWAIIPIIILTGAAAGAVNAMIIVTLKIGNSFIVTLATLYIFLSLSYVLAGGYSLPGMPPLVQALGQGYTFGIPNAAIVMVICAVVVACSLHTTVWGRWVFGIGGSADAGQRMGIPVARVQTSIFIAVGVLVGVAAIIVGGRADAGFPDNGNSVLLAIAAVVIGGAALTGGRGSVTGTFVGALIIGSITNGLGLLSVDPNLLPLAVGCVLVAAVGIDAVRGRVETSLKLRQARVQAGV